MRLHQPPGWFNAREAQGATDVYSYAQAETVLARLYGADEQVQRGAFRGRLKHFKRLGIPLNMAPGRGKKIFYTKEHVFQWSICLEFSEFGIDPTLTARFIHEFWRVFQACLQEIEGTRDKAGDVIFTINPIIMSKTWKQPPGGLFREKFPDFQDMSPAQLSDDNLLSVVLGSDSRRGMLMNLSEVVRLIDVESRELGVPED